MNTRQLLLSTCLKVLLTISLLIAVAMCIRCYEVKLSKTEQQLVDATTKLETLNASLETRLVIAKEQLKRTNAELEKFTSPIEYSVAAAPIYDIPLSAELQQYTYDTCTYYGIQQHYELVLGMMWQESDYNPALISDTNDYGIMQINACNHGYLRETLGIVDFLDAKSSIDGGVYIISILLNKYEDPNMALMAYNMGSYGAAQQWKKGNYSSNYSRAIISKAELIATNQYY